MAEVQRGALAYLPSAQGQGVRPSWPWGAPPHHREAMPMVFAQPTVACPAPPPASLPHCSPGRGRAPCSPIFLFFQREEGGWLQLSGWICGPAWPRGGCLRGQRKLEGAAGPGRGFLGGEWGEGAPSLAAGPGSLDGVTWAGRGPQRAWERAALTPHLCCEALGLTCSLVCSPMAPFTRRKKPFSSWLSWHLWLHFHVLKSNDCTWGRCPRPKALRAGKAAPDPAMNQENHCCPPAVTRGIPNPARGLWVRDKSSAPVLQAKAEAALFNVLCCGLKKNNNSNITLEWESESPAGEGKRDSSPWR